MFLDENVVYILFMVCEIVFLVSFSDVMKVVCGWFKISMFCVILMVCWFMFKFFMYVWNWVLVSCFFMDCIYIIDFVFS